MPVRNEEKFIGESLSAILKQNYPAEKMEVVIVDGMSSDKTVEMIEHLAGLYKVRVIVIKNPKGIAAAGLNAALERSVGKIIVRVDGHTVIEPDYVSRCVELLEKTGAANVGGRMDARGETNFGRAVALATGSPFGIGNSRFHYSKTEQETDTVYLGAWRREIFERNGLFNEELVRNQDDEFNYRLRERGGVIFLSPKIRSTYYNRSSLRMLWQQYFLYGFWKVRVMQLHPKQMSTRQFVPAVFISALIGASMAAIVSAIGFYLLISIIGIYLLGALIGAISIAGRKNFVLIPLVAICFIILHFSYGSGFLTGLFYFWNRWNVKTANKLLAAQ